MMSRHPIRVAARRAGLTPATLRAWERRYAAVLPERTQGGQRLYSDAQVDRLTLLRRATEGGRSIQQLAGLSDEDLQALVAEDLGEGWTSTGGPPPSGAAAAAETIERAWVAITRLDADTLEALLRGAAVARGLQGLAEEIVRPLLVRVGEAWTLGQISPAHEHIASATLRRILSWMTDATSRGGGAGPRLVLATPSGERHELGAMMAAVAAATAGWQVTYLGPDLPADALAQAARSVGARAVGLSIVRTDAAHREYLLELRRQLDSGVQIIVGGPAAEGLAGMEDLAGIARASGLDDFRALPAGQ